MYTKKYAGTGGQIVHYKRTKWHYRWRPLKIHHMDCGPNCFFVLKYADKETCIEMARRTRDGVEPSQIVNILDNAYGEGHKWQSISAIGYRNEYLNDKFIDRNGDEDYDVSSYFINTYLEPNEATFASIDFGDYLHFFVVLRDPEGFYAIDPQTGKTTMLEKYMNFYLEKYLRVKLSIVVSESHQREPNKVTMNMIKDFFPTRKELQKSFRKEERQRTQHERESMGMANLESRRTRKVSKSRSRSSSI